MVTLRVILLGLTGLLFTPFINLASGYMLVTLETESDALFRGRQVSGPAMRLAMDFGQGDFYGGLARTTPFEDKPWDFQTTEAYAGVNRGIHPLLTLDAGILAYDRTTRNRPGLEDGFEVFAGLSLEYLFRPRLFLYYDLKQDRFTLEATGRKALDLDLPWDADLYLEANVGTSMSDADQAPSWSFAGAGLRFEIPIHDAIFADFFLGSTIRDRQIDEASKGWLQTTFSVTAQF